MSIEGLNPDELRDMWTEQTSPLEGLRVTKQRTGELFWSYQGRRAKAFIRAGAWRWARIYPRKSHKTRLGTSSELVTFEQLEALVRGVITGEAG